MAPRRVKPASSPAWYEPALDAPNISEKNLTATLLLTTGESNEKGKTGLRAGSDVPVPEGSTFFPFFTSSIVVGLVPPFSDFFYKVLGHYGLQALHLSSQLHPPLVDPRLLLQGVPQRDAVCGCAAPLLLLRINDDHTSGCANFVAAGKANAISKAGKKADGFRSKWVTMDAKVSTHD